MGIEGKFLGVARKNLGKIKGTWCWQLNKVLAYGETPLFECNWPVTGKNETACKADVFDTNGGNGYWEVVAYDGTVPGGRNYFAGDFRRGDEDGPMTDTDGISITVPYTIYMRIYIRYNDIEGGGEAYLCHNFSLATNGGTAPSGGGIFFLRVEDRRFSVSGSGIGGELEGPLITDDIWYRYEAKIINGAGGTDSIFIRLGTYGGGAGTDVTDQFERDSWNLGDENGSLTLNLDKYLNFHNANSGYPAYYYMHCAGLKVTSGGDWIEDG